MSDTTTRKPMTLEQGLQNFEKVIGQKQVLLEGFAELLILLEDPGLHKSDIYASIKKTLTKHNSL